MIWSIGVLVLGLLTPGWGAETPRAGLEYGSTERENSNLAKIDMGLRVDWGVSAQTIADNGVGSSRASVTVTPATLVVVLDCDDSDGCDVLIAETGVESAKLLIFVGAAGTQSNVLTEACSAYPTDCSLKLESSSVSFGEADTVSLIYVHGAWTQLTGRLLN